MPALGVHHTATVSTAWDGPAQETKLETPLTEAIGKATFAWQEADSDGTHKNDFKFIHHMVGEDGKPGAANTKACGTGIGVLNGEMGGTKIPKADYQGVYDHLIAHLKDAGFADDDLPELKASPMTDTLETTRSPAGTLRAKFYGQELPAELVEMRRSSAIRRCVRQMDPLSKIAQKFEMREVPNGTGGTSLLFTGYASVFDADYDMFDMFGPYVESVALSACHKTLAEGADVAFLANHDGITMARTKSGTLKLSSDTGLYTEARLNASRSDVQIVRATVEDEDLDEMSFAFRVIREEWDEAYEHRTIQEVNLNQGDVSIVNYGANPHTGGLVDIQARAAAAELRGLTLATLDEFLTELRAGTALSSAGKATLQHVLSLASTADTAVDELQVVLSKYLGVTNPDDAQDEAMHNQQESQANASPVLLDHTSRARADLLARRRP